jgi:uncharacterized protein YhdP
LLRYVLRPLLVLLTLGALVIALLQVGGRVLFALLEDLEVGVNQVLSSQDIEVSGLTGDWRMLNPIVTVDRVRLPEGELLGLELEVDMIASVLRGVPLARRLRIDHADVALVKPAGEPWRLAGVQGPRPLDPWPLLRFSEQIEVAGTLRLRRHGLGEEAVEGHYIGINRGGVHRHRLVLNNVADDCADPCLLIADLQARGGLWPLRGGEFGVVASARGFLLPRALLGVSTLRLAELDLSWHRSGRNSGGRFELAAEQFHLPGQVSLATSLSAVVRGRDAVQRGAVRDWHVHQGEAESWRLPDMAITVDQGAASLWLAELDLGRAGQFIGQALAGVGPTQEWLEALQIDGRARNVRAHVRFADAAIGYAMRLDDLRLEAYKGVPGVRGASGDLLGFERGAQLNLNAQDMSLAFPDLFTEGWRLPYARGLLQAWFEPDYFGLRGSNLRAEALDIRARGSFALARPPDRQGQRLLLRVETDRIDVATAQRFVPYKVPDALRTWLADGPREGALLNARLAMQGQIHTEPGELGRRIELGADIAGGRVRYHPDWPEVAEVDGRLAVAGPEVHIDVDRGVTAGARLSRTQVVLFDNGRLADVSMNGQLDGQEVLTLLRTTPLGDWLGFVEPDWRLSGPLRVSGDLQVPLRTGLADALAIRLRTDLDGVDLTLPRYRVELAGLAGSWRYRYPAEVGASGVTGTLFGQPVRIGASSRDQRVQLRLDGRARPEDVWSMLGVADPGLAEGELDYRVEVGLPVGVPGAPTLTVRSDLEGLALRLPAGFAKAAETVEPLEVRLTFLGDHQRLSFAYRDATGWLRFADHPWDGAIGFGVPPPLPEPHPEAGPGAQDDGLPEPGRLVVRGRLAEVRVDELVPDGIGPGALPLSVFTDELHIDTLLLGGFPVTGARLSGSLSAAGVDLRVDADQVSGRVSGGDDEILEVALETLRVPRGEGAGDPITPTVVARLPPARVSLERLLLGDEDFGRWRFALRPEGQVLYLDDLEASIRGVRLEASEPLVWDTKAGTTRFAGSLMADDLAGVLPQWGYAPSIETRNAHLTGTFTWSGSPAAVDLLTLSGSAELHAEEGRFLDVESGGGAQRIFSLINFTTIAKRMSLNFSDVFGRGISFDTLKSRFTLDEGVLAFVEPLDVEGTGSRFRISGSVDLAARRLDNDMIVTLPVTRSLPWYAAYVALANPLAGIGVLVGERVLRRPLEQFSSARYRIGGTLDDPQVSFVSVFDVSPAEAAVSAGAPPSALGGVPDEEPVEETNSIAVEDDDE